MWLVINANDEVQGCLAEKCNDLSAITGAKTQVYVSDAEFQPWMTKASYIGGVLVDQRPYDLQRREDYPDIGDQLDAIWKLLEAKLLVDAGTEARAIKDAIDAVKAKYPVA